MTNKAERVAVQLRVDAVEKVDEVSRAAFADASVLSC